MSHTRSYSNIRDNLLFTFRTGGTGVLVLHGEKEVPVIANTIEVKGGVCTATSETVGVVSYKLSELQGAHPADYQERPGFAW